MPPNAGDVLVVIVMLVIRASAGAPAQISDTTAAATAEQGAFLHGILLVVSGTPPIAARRNCGDWVLPRRRQ
jgi:hypothetical protein